VLCETKLRIAQAIKPAWNKDFLALIFAGIFVYGQKTAKKYFLCRFF